MSLLPSEASYAEQVADYFLAFKGVGLNVSALDAELVMEWERQGVPLAVVCRGIRKAAEARRRTQRPEAAALRSLRACARAVEAEHRQYQGLSAGRTGSTPASDAGPARLKKAQTALQRARRLAPPPLQRAIERVMPLAQQRVASPIEAAAQVAYVDEALALCYLRALPFRERVQIGRSLRSDLGATLRAKSPRARRSALRAHRVMRARLHGRLPVLA